jgi:hypothetical protein
MNPQDLIDISHVVPNLFSLWATKGLAHQDLWLVVKSLILYEISYFDPTMSHCNNIKSHWITIHILYIPVRIQWPLLLNHYILSAFEIGVVIGIVFWHSIWHTHTDIRMYNIYIYIQTHTHTPGILAENSAAAQELPFFKLAVRLCS